MERNLYEEFAKIDMKVSQFRDITHIVVTIMAIVVLGHLSWS